MVSRDVRSRAAKSRRQLNALEPGKVQKIFRSDVAILSTRKRQHGRCLDHVPLLTADQSLTPRPLGYCKVVAPLVAVVGRIPPLMEAVTSNEDRK